MARRVVIRIYGAVQGVSFRYYTLHQAKKVGGLVGFVSNEPDGSVLMVAEGDENKLQQLIAWCKTGPPLAHVERFEVDWSPATGEFEEFRVK
jgi:acylphosphatase